MDHNHQEKSSEKINCAICREISQKPEVDLAYSSPLKGRQLFTTPHKLVDGVMAVCNNPDCRICTPAQGLEPNIVYHLDLPNSCPKCGDNSCCEGIERERVFNIK